jgi:serine/threonine-protein kinase
VQEGGGSGGLVAVLSFIAGVLVVGVGGGLAWLLLQTNQPTTGPSSTGFPGLNGTPTTPEPQAPSTDAPPAPELGLGSTDAATAQAVSSVEQLYNELSMGNMQAARQRFSGEAADQFDPAFFRQFQRVSVDKLQETGRNGSLVTLEGLVTFVYPDGTSQSESRRFTVDTATNPALITGSSFGQVMQGRQ